MSYRRGGDSGAVAVSYGTSAMSPLSPSRRYPGTTGSGSSGTSGTNGSANTMKYNNYRSSTPSNLVNERNGGYYPSTSNTGYRSNSYKSTASSDKLGRSYCSPARSVSSYSEPSSILGPSSSSSTVKRYNSSLSSSSASSSSNGSSTNSSSFSRERTNFQHQTAGSLATEVADLYAKYSAANYIPNIHSGGSKIIGNPANYSSSSSLSSPSGIKTSFLLSELRINENDSFDAKNDNEHENLRKSRERSCTSEASSGIGLSSDASAVSSNGKNFSLATSSSTENWTTRSVEIVKRRALIGSASCVTSENTKNRNFKPTDDPANEVNRDNEEITLKSNVTIDVFVPAAAAAAAAAAADNAKNTKILPLESITNFTRKTSRSSVEIAISNDNDKTDDTNDDDDEKNNNNANETKLVNTRNSNVDNDGTSTNEPGQKNLTNPLRNVDDNPAHDKTIIDNYTREILRSNDHHYHQRERPSEKIFTKEIVNDPEIVDDSSSLSLSGSAKNLMITRRPRHGNICPLGIRENLINNPVESRNDDDNDDFGIFGTVDSVYPDDSEAADKNRIRALTRTNIITNVNTELETNKSVGEKELGIADKTSKYCGNDDGESLANDRSAETRNNAGKMMIKGGRRLTWTVTSETEDDDDIYNETDNNDESTNRYECSNDRTNGRVKSLKNHSNIRDFDGSDEEETSLMINGIGTTNNRSDDMEKGSSFGRTIFGWNDSSIDDLTGTTSSSSSSSSSTVTSTSSTSSASSSSSTSTSTSSSAAASSSSATNSIPVAVHQNIYRGVNEQIDESSNSRPPRSRLQSRRDERYGLNGLRNIGNTCFMNSVIQCLSNTRPLLEYLLNEQHHHDINTTTSGMKGALIKAFGQVIQELWEISGDHVINTTALKSQIQRFAPRFMGYSQQDAQEFLRYLLEGLHEDVNRVVVKPAPILTDIPDHYSDSHKASESWKRYLRSEDSTIVDVFVGQLRSSLHCTACDRVSVTLDPFWDLSLPIPLRLGTVKLNQCLEHFTKVETLDGDEKPTCSKCQMRRKCTKRFSIQKFPKILVIHLKRFSPTERFRGKLSVLVDFPLTGLDLSAFAAPGVQGCTYNLYGVANHSGTTYSGHYTAYCKHPYSGEWHEYNDSRVSTVSARSVVSSEAYVLFYEQQSSSSSL